MLRVGATKWNSVVLISLSGAQVRAAVIAYEGDGFPEQMAPAWERSTYCSPVRWIEQSWLIQQLDAPGECNPPPGGDLDRYLASLAPFTNAPSFFVEWRIQTDGDRSEIPFTAPSSLVLGGSGPVGYHFTIARDQIRFIRDNFAPVLYIEIAPDQAHTYRLELYGITAYAWYVDGDMIDSGVPEGQFPSAVSDVLSMRAKSQSLPNTTRWDYIRFGSIPQPASGDFDSSGAVDANDVYFFLDCLLGPDSAGPGCRWADMNNDGTVNGGDVQLFAALLLNS